jgi:hypothetical protein
MGWEDCHLHQFEIGRDRYGPRDAFADGWTSPPKNESTAKLYSVAPAGTRFMYEYDFGDSWQHEIIVEKVEKVPADAAGARAPVCLSGRRACPPEDCGRVWGYEHLLEVLADPDHEEHEDMVEWLGGEHDPEQFDLAAVNVMLERFVGRSLAVASRR